MIPFVGKNKRPDACDKLLGIEPTTSAKLSDALEYVLTDQGPNFQPQPEKDNILHFQTTTWTLAVKIWLGQREKPAFLNRTRELSTCTN